MISAWESLHFATLELVRATPIKQRLICAYRRHLVAIPDDQLPNEVRDSFSRLMSSLHRVEPLRGEDAVAASVRKMSNQEADDCAARIVEIFGITCRLLLNAARASAAVVQLHSGERDGDYFQSGISGDSEEPGKSGESGDFGQFEMPALRAQLAGSGA